MQLLKSYTGYNSWMAKAARDGAADKLQKGLDVIVPDSKEPTNVADRASLMMKIGRRHVFDGKYEAARQILLKANDLIQDRPEVQNVMKDDDYPRLLEWVGMVKHWTYDLSSAAACYQVVADLEPINVSIFCSATHIHTGSACDLSF